MKEDKAEEVLADPDASRAQVLKADEVDGERAEDNEAVEVVEFLERPGTRLITRDDWAAAGVPDHPDTYWNQHNGWTVARADLALNDEQYARIIKMDTGFRTGMQVPQVLDTADAEG